MNEHLPNLVMVGPGRTGSTSLFRALAGHSLVEGSRVKEVSAFNPVLFGAHPDLTRYQGAFDPSSLGHYRLEATPVYFVGGRKMAESLNQTLDRPRVIVILREPWQRLNSLYRHTAAKDPQGQGVQASEFLSLGLDVLRGTRSPERLFELGVSEGCYGTLLSEWLEVFGDRLHIVWYDDLQSDRSRVLAALEDWLGIPPELDELPLENQSIAVRSGKMHRWAMALNHRMESALNRQPRLRAKLRALYYNLNASGEPLGQLPQSLELDEFYENEMKRLAVLIEGANSDAPTWAGGNVEP